MHRLTRAGSRDTGAFLPCGSCRDWGNAEHDAWLGCAGSGNDGAVPTAGSGGLDCVGSSWQGVCAGHAPILHAGARMASTMEGGADALLPAVFWNVDRPQPEI